jgi:2-isopropylmalate synthase
MEEVVMALRVRPAYFENIYTQIATEHFFETSQMVSELTGIPVQPNKAIVGRNAFAHESGIHQDGFLKGSSTYEIMTPESVGVIGTALPLGPRSGRAALKARLHQLGFQPNDEQMPIIFEAFKRMADEKKRIEDEDLKVLIEQVFQTV